MTALIALNIAAWGGAALFLCGSVRRLFVGPARADDELLAALCLISLLIALFFARRLVAATDEATFTALSTLALILALYVYRLGWAHGCR